MTDKPKAVQHSRSQLRRIASQQGLPMPEFNAAPQADELLRECRRLLAKAWEREPEGIGPFSKCIEQIDAHLNAAPQDASIRKGEDGIVDTDSRKVESVTSPVATPAGAAPATERGELIKQIQERARIRRQIPTRKSVQEGQPDRIADLLERAAAALSRDREDADELLRECRETMLTLARGKPVRDLDEQISRIDAHLNAATQPSRISPIVLCNQHGGRGFVRDCIVCNPVGVEQEPVGTATERGELMPKPFMPLHRTIEWSQAEIDKGETVWGLGDIDRGFQNMGMEINRLRAALSRDSEDADDLLRECRELLALTAEAMCDDPSTHTPTCGRIMGAITRIDAFLNAAPQDASIRKGEDGIVDTDSRKVESVTSPVATPASAAPDGMPKPIPFAFVIGENDDANCYGFIACNIHKGNEFQVPVYSKTTVDALLARIDQLEKDRALSLPDCVSVPVGPTDTELLNWAERHPEQSMSEIRSWWTTCGRGSREISFNFRGVIRGAMLAARGRKP